MKVIDGGFGKKPCSDLSIQLREMADAVDRGEITDFTCAYVQDDGYKLMHAASLTQSLVLATLLQTSAVEKFHA